MDSLPEPGGQVSALYPEKLIFDVAGFPAVKGQELIERCVDQAAPYDPIYLLNHRAQTLEPHEDGSFTVTTHRGARGRDQGRDDHRRDRDLHAPAAAGRRAVRGAGLVYFVRELEVMRDLDVLIVGGGDSAVDWALNLEGIARSITLIHRRDRFRAHEDSVAKLYASSVDVLTHTEVAHIHGSDGIEGVTVFDNRDDDRRRLEVQAVVAALGFKSDLGPLRDWNIEIDGRHVLVDTRMETNIPGVFAAGDITDYEGKVRLIAVGFGEAATAVNNAAVHIDPTARVFPGHSSGG
jgi:ferredoxin/flavodoxin---NADP+ reductase